MIRREPATAAMIATRRRDSHERRARVTQTLEAMLADGTPITFTAVARLARVSTWLVHADGVRDAIERAREQQRAELAPPPPHGHAASQGSLRTDIALARDEIKRLRTQIDELRGNLRRALGNQLDNLNRTDLVARVDELVDHNTRLLAETHQLRTSNDVLTTAVAELEGDLAAARTSLRRMIRAENRPT
jgi:methyl-accepting chemotaxis protein